jgi:hypothetical protein
MGRPALRRRLLSACFVVPLFEAVRESDTTLLQVFLDREGDPALETGRRENVNRAGNIGERLT